MLFVLTAIVFESGEGDRNIILIDSRIGSKHLAILLGDKAVLTQLEYGDAAFSGNGVTVGVEVKTVGDAVSCLYSGRLADRQIPGLRASFDVAYLIIEGVYRPDPESGVLQIWREFKSEKDVKCGRWVDVSAGQKRLMYSAFECWLATLASFGSLQVRSTPSAHTTASLILSLWNWYQREDHKSFQTMHQAEGSEATLSRPTMLRRMLALLPHVAWDRSAVLGKRVSGVQFLKRGGGVVSGEDWFIEGQIAAKSAADIDAACSGEDQRSLGSERSNERSRRNYAKNR